MDTFKIISIIFMMIVLYQIYQLNCTVYKDKVEGFEGATQSLGGVDDANAINTLAQIARKLMDEGLTVPGSMTVTGVSKAKGGLEIANKWGLYDTGDAWIRLNNIGNKTTDMNGESGIAMQKLSVNTIGYVNNIVVNSIKTGQGRDILAELDKLNSRWNGNNLTVDSITSSGEGIFRSPITISTGDSIPLRLVTPGGNQSKILMKGGGKAARFILDGNGKIYTNDNEPNYA